ncbi:MAG: L-rhamnose mutarotase [Actinomycetota bacterium]|jgi:L-rhamnose mutarotase
MKRVASVIQLRPEHEREYRELHAAVWPEVLSILTEHGVTNYSIFFRDGMLFSYLEFVGDDYEASMAAIAEHQVTKDWWKLTDPCQVAVDTASPGEWWAALEEVFHHD